MCNSKDEIGAPVDWPQLFFRVETQDKMRYLAQKRFSNESVADEAGNYVIEKVSENNWKRFSSFKQQSQPSTYLHSVIVNLIEEFSRKRYGRPRPPEWLKRAGPTWVEVWKRICLERQSIEEVKVAMAACELREERELVDIFRAIKAKLPSCGEYRREISFCDLGNQDKDFSEEASLVEMSTPITLISNQLLNELKGVLSEKVFGDVHQADDQQSKYLEGFSIEMIGALRNRIDLTDDQKILLKMKFQDGFSVAAIARVLGLSAPKVSEAIRKAQQQIQEILQELKLDQSSLSDGDDY